MYIVFPYIQDGPIKAERRSSMCFLYTSDPLVTMRIDKIKWITAHNCGNSKEHSFKPRFSWKGEFWTLSNIYFVDIVSLKICPIENKLNPDWNWSWYHFSQKKIPHPLIPVIASTLLWEICCSAFIVPPCIGLWFREDKLDAFIHVLSENRWYRGYISC